MFTFQKLEILKICKNLRKLKILKICQSLICLNLRNRESLIFLKVLELINS